MPEAQIEMPAPGVHSKPEWQAFLSLGFRPLYLAGCSWAVVSIALWIFTPQWLVGDMASLYWHVHEILWGFIATIAVGFLLTASANWCGRNPLQGRALGGLVMLWLVARAGFLVPGHLSFVVAAVSELLFFMLAALALGRVIYAVRRPRNYGLPMLVLALGVTDALFLWAMQTGDYGLLMQRFNLGLLCMAVIALLIARRVIPFFAMRALPGLQIPMLTASGWVQLVASVLAVGFLALGWPRGQAVALSLAGGIALWQVLLWRPWVAWRVPLLWVLYLGYAALGAGLLVAAAYAQGWVVRGAWPVHVIAVAGFSVLIIGMVTRTALGHLGRPLQTDACMVGSFALVLVAAALRLLALLPGGHVQLTLQASACAWVLGFGLYLWRFVPWLIRPRADA